LVGMDHCVLGNGVLVGGYRAFKGAMWRQL